MKQLLVGGGLIDFATLHPLWTALAVLVAVLATRWVIGALGPGRRARVGRRRD